MGLDDRIDRREYLTLLGLSATGAIAGCADDDGDDSGDEADDTGETDDSATDEGSDEETEPAETDDEGEETSEADQDSSEGSDDDDEDEPGPAAFEIVDVQHPDEVEVGEEHTIGITVENVGGQTGDFQEMLQISTTAEPGWEDVGLYGIGDVEPGETATESTDPFAFDEPATYQFRIADTEWEYPAIRVVEEIGEQSFSGSGAEVRRDISIEGGLTVIEASHDGERNFQVSLEDDTDFGEIFINVIGGFDGAQANLVDEGEYILDVNADGNWDLTIRQPRAAEGDQLPVSISGEGPRVFGPIEFEGTGVATGEHDGESNFQVEILPMEGAFGEIVFNEIGAFDGETSYSFDGIGWIDINADGAWTLEFE